MRRSLPIAVAVAALVTGTVYAAGPAGAALGAPVSAPVSAPAPVPAPVPVTDFNADGYADIAVAAPAATVSGRDDAGYVTVLYGSIHGVDSAHPQVISRASAGVPGAVVDYDAFGRVSAARDFDGDGYTDLVVGSENGPTVVLWGSPVGLKKSVALSLPPHNGPLAAGDINGDGQADLVVGTGLVGVEFGPISRSGTSAGRTVVPFGDEEDSRYDFIVGDVTGDGADDILTTHGFEDHGHGTRLWKGGKDGSVTRIPGAITPSSKGVVADFDRDGYGDFATFKFGTSHEDIATLPGTVEIRFGSPSGLSTRKTTITQNTPGVPGVDEAGDQFGLALAAGDVTGDGYPDLAVGVPGEAIGRTAGAGSVVLLKGGPKGPTGKGALAFSQSTKGVPGVSERDDRFGEAVQLADVNDNNRADLIVAAPWEDAPKADSGAAWVLRGSKNGPVTQNIATFNPATLGTPAAEAHFGASFAR
ncbi:FG-GAP and VCBS repeat-containing protein [Streptomyces sp. NPDC007084]|uniref:FG-GAP and VCBS repeat-containing protein n=1 Tax=Streptomyces sp. NPDC007084 TaxID=3154313 RepID=UPI003453FB43